MVKCFTLQLLQVPLQYISDADSPFKS